MKITNLVAITVVLALVSTADAQRRRAFSSSKRYQSNGKFGLGLELGEPTGINGKLFVAPDQALNFGIGDIYHNYYVGGDGLHLYLDYLWHPIELASTDDFKLPFYVGVGGRVWFFDYNCPGAGPCDGASIFGVRIPVGVAFDFNNVPLDVFVQFVPTLDFYRDYANRDFALDIDFSLGIRYWFT